LYGLLPLPAGVSKILQIISWLRFVVSGAIRRRIKVVKYLQAFIHFSKKLPQLSLLLKLKKPPFFVKSIPTTSGTATGHNFKFCFNSFIRYAVGDRSRREIYAYA
jgi:hypothetical protein